MPEPKYDWERAHDVYVEGRVDDKGVREWLTHEHVAMLFDIPPERLRSRAKAEDWESQRTAYKIHHQRVLDGKRQADLAKEATDFDARALSAAKIGLQLVQMRGGQVLKRAAELAKAEAEAKSKGEEFEDYGVSPIDARELASLAAAAEGWQRVGAKALGEVETTRTEITGPAGAPLEMRQSISAELARDDTDRLYGIVVAMDAAGLLPGGLAAARQPEAIEAPGEDGDDAG